MGAITLRSLAIVTDVETQFDASEAAEARWVNRKGLIADLDGGRRQTKQELLRRRVAVWDQMWDRASAKIVCL
jgi:hypothetical protein